MVNVLFVCAAESEGVPEGLKRLRVDLTKLETVRVVPSIPAARASGQSEVAALIQSADAIVVCFARGARADVHEPAPNTTAMADTPALCETHITLDASQRSRLPDRTIVVVLGRADDSSSLPNDLVAWRRFEISSPDSYDALLCQLGHKVVASRDTLGQRWKDGTGTVRLAAGMGAMIIGNQDKTQDLLLGRFGRGAETVYVLMVVAVLVLLVTGLAALLRTGYQACRAWAPNHTEIVAFLDRWKWRKAAGIAVAALIALVFGVNYLPAAPSVDASVERHVHAWATRLRQSEMASGAIREHPEEGVGQAWISAQALAGLLSMGDDAGWSRLDRDRVFAFIGRSQIGEFQLKTTPDSRRALAAVVGPVEESKVPARVPSLAFLYDSLAFGMRQVELPSSTVKAMDSRQATLFEGTVNGQGWGYFEQFEWGVTEITAWIAVAEVASLRDQVQGYALNPEERAKTKQNLRQLVDIVRRRQIPGLGGFSPVADITHRDFVRTYATAMAIWAMTEATAPDLQLYTAAERSDIESSVHEAVLWLAQTAGAAGWQVNPANPTGAKPFLGLTAQVLWIVSRASDVVDEASEVKFAAVRAHLLADSTTWVQLSMDENDRMHDSDRYLFPTEYVTEGSTFLWYPWTVALTRLLSDGKPSDPESTRAASAYNRLRSRVGDYGVLALSEYNYAAAEGIIGLTWPPHIPQ